MPRNNAPFPGGPGSPRWRQSTPRCSAAPVWCPVGASLLLGPSGLYVHYIRTYGTCQGGSQKLTESSPESLRLNLAAIGTADPAGQLQATGDSVPGTPSGEYPGATPPRRGVGGWI